jgi:hypothetical protein
MTTVPAEQWETLLSVLDAQELAAREAYVTALRSRVARTVRLVFPTATTLRCRWSPGLGIATVKKVYAGDESILWEEGQGEFAQIPGASQDRLAQVELDIWTLFQIRGCSVVTGVRKNRKEGSFELLVMLADLLPAAPLSVRQARQDLPVHRVTLVYGSNEEARLAKEMVSRRSSDVLALFVGNGQVSLSGSDKDAVAYAAQLLIRLMPTEEVDKSWDGLPVLELPCDLEETG